jgi:hypothetical protein
MKRRSGTKPAERIEELQAIVSADIGDYIRTSKTGELELVPLLELTPAQVSAIKVREIRIALKSPLAAARKLARLLRLKGREQERSDLGRRFLRSFREAVAARVQAAPKVPQVRPPSPQRGKGHDTEKVLLNSSARATLRKVRCIL